MALDISCRLCVSNRRDRYWKPRRLLLFNRRNILLLACEWILKKIWSHTTSVETSNRRSMSLELKLRISREISITYSYILFSFTLSFSSLSLPPPHPHCLTHARCLTLARCLLFTLSHCLILWILSWCRFYSH